MLIQDHNLVHMFPEPYFWGEKPLSTEKFKMVGIFQDGYHGCHQKLFLH